MIKVNRIYKGEFSVVLTNSGADATIYNKPQQWRYYAIINVPDPEVPWIHISVWSSSTLELILKIFDDEKWQENPWAWLVVFVSGLSERSQRKHAMPDTLFGYAPIWVEASPVAQNREKFAKWFVESLKVAKDPREDSPTSTADEFAKLLYDLFWKGWRSVVRVKREEDRRLIILGAQNLYRFVPDTLKPPLRKILARFVVADAF